MSGAGDDSGRAVDHHEHALLDTQPRSMRSESRAVTTVSFSLLPQPGRELHAPSRDPKRHNVRAALQLGSGEDWYRKPV
jgi:hypothetical protein